MKIMACLRIREQKLKRKYNRRWQWKKKQYKIACKTNMKSRCYILIKMVWLLKKNRADSMTYSGCSSRFTRRWIKLVSWLSFSLMMLLNSNTRMQWYFTKKMCGYSYRKEIKQLTPLKDGDAPAIIMLFNFLIKLQTTRKDYQVNLLDTPEIICMIFNRLPVQLQDR